MPANSSAIENSNTALPLLIDAAGVAFALSIAQRTLWRWISMGTFPPPDLSIGAKVRRWRRETVENWIAQHSEARAE